MDLPWGFYLGWDWPWLVFFIVLGVSVALASVMKNWQVLWVIPGLVLYGGLLWELPGVLSFLFKLVFWLAVIVAIVTALLPGRTRLARVPLYMMAALVIWCLVLALFDSFDELPGSPAVWVLVVLAVLVGLFLLLFKTVIGGIIIAAAIVVGLINLAVGIEGSDYDDSVVRKDVCETIRGNDNPKVQLEVPKGFKVDSAKDCTPIRKKREDIDTGDEPVACPDRFRQELDPNRRFRFESDGFRGTAREKRRQLVAALGHDYRYLDFVAEQLFRRSIADSSLVTEGRRCLSEKGQTLHAKVEGALMASGVRTGLAPQDGYNTGVKNGEAVVAKRRGVYGDRKATIYTLADGSRLIILDRCGNMVFKSKPKGMPEGPTDNPPPKKDKPPKQHTQPPSGEGGCVEIPDNGVYDCGGKEPSEEPAQQGNVPEQVTGENPGTGGAPASQPSAQPPATYTPPPPPSSGSSGSVSGESTNSGGTPPVEETAPQHSGPESTTQDPCPENPDWC